MKERNGEDLGESIDPRLGRRIHADDDAQGSLFDLGDEGYQEWWGMPQFEMGDARPRRRIVMNFMAESDVRALGEKLGIKIGEGCDSLWWPPQKHLNGTYFWDGPKITTRWPVYIPSKGRAACQTTGKLLDRMGVKHHFVVEETEADEYRKNVGEDKVLVLPFHNLGQGSIPARNWLWEHAKSIGADFHWCMDDNIKDFARTTHNRRLIVKTGGMFRAMEDFVGRYENVALAGPHDRGFVPDRIPNLTPFLLNSRVYSCILIRTDLPYRWRGRYNEDTDLSLRALKDGWCTVLFRALLMGKTPTQTMKGGNTDNVYNADKTRLAFAESLRDQHPDVTKIVWRFGRWHHHVNYKPFEKNKLKMKTGIVQTVDDNDFGMRLVESKGEDVELFDIGQSSSENQNEDAHDDQHHQEKKETTPEIESRRDIISVDGAEAESRSPFAAGCEKDENA